MSDETIDNSHNKVVTLSLFEYYRLRLQLADANQRIPDLQAQLQRAHEISNAWETSARAAQKRGEDAVERRFFHRLDIAERRAYLDTRRENRRHLRYISQQSRRIAELEAQLAAAIANRDEADRLRKKAEEQCAAWEKMFDAAKGAIDDFGEMNIRLHNQLVAANERIARWERLAKEHFGETDPGCLIGIRNALDASGQYNLDLKSLTEDLDEQLTAARAWAAAWKRAAKKRHGMSWNDYLVGYYPRDMPGIVVPAPVKNKEEMP